MPTLLRTPQGWAIRIYTNDHDPPHVHLVAPSAEARFELRCDEGRVELSSNFGFPRRSLVSVARLLIERIVELCAAWSRIHE